MTGRDELRHRRLRLGLSQEDLAAAVGTTPNTISRWELGQTDPQLRFFKPLAEALQIPLVDLRGHLKVESVDRRDFLKASGVLISSAELGTSDTNIESLRRIRTQIVSLEALYGPQSAVTAARVQLNSLRSLISEATTQRNRLQLLELAAMYAEFLSWMADDSGDLQGGQYWSSRALDWANAACSSEAVAYIMMRRAQQGILLGDSAQVVIMGEAVASTERNPRRIRAAAALQLSHGYAMQGDSQRACRQFEAAVGLIECSTAEDLGPLHLARFCTLPYAYAQYASSLNKLGSHREAAQTYRETLARWPESYRRERGLHLSRYSVALAESGEFEEALSIACEAVAIAENVRSARTITELHTFDTLISGRGLRGPEVELFRHGLKQSGGVSYS